MLLGCCCQLAYCQRRITVLDLESGLPVYKATVRVDSDQVCMTDQLGRAYVDEPFKVIVFSHLKYRQEQLSYPEVGDTMYMIPSERVLDELVVTGISPDLYRKMKEHHDAYEEAPNMNVGENGLEFDLGKLLDRRGRRDRKHLRKAREVIRKLDEQKAASPSSK